MKFLRMTIFAGFLMAAMSVGVMAQKDDKKPKPKPPVVKPGGQKPPNGNPPKGGDKPKKPETSWFLFAKASSAEERA